jgi:hypothetical protein
MNRTLLADALADLRTGLDILSDDQLTARWTRWLDHAPVGPLEEGIRLIMLLGVATALRERGITR